MLKKEEYSVEKDGFGNRIARFFRLGGYEEKVREVSYASVQDAIEQIDKIIKESQKLINTECRNIFNIKDFSNNIINTLIKAKVFDLADKDFEPDSIISPLNQVLRSMNINEIKLNKDYADIIVEKVSGNSETLLEFMQEVMENLPEEY